MLFTGSVNCVLYKYVEDMGMSIRHLLCKKDPVPEHCGQPTCFPCKETPGKCMRKGALYQIRCLGCQREGKEMLYIGETARTPYDRGLEHMRAIENSNPESPMVEHCHDHHQGILQEFTMKVMGFP